ncbi:hypothetical protein MWU59_07910 [Flavobacteriaceae bacterium F08102]|nr:hypothetical protein [Flavobacteriaceae bacterium F08102]
MGKFRFVLGILFAFSSCTNNPLNVDMRNLASNLSDSPTSGTSKKTVKSTNQTDCLYQVIKYDQTHIKPNESFENVSWDAETHTSYIQLTNKDQITIQQEGCEYYSIEFNWRKAKDQHDLTDLTHWLTETKWLYKSLAEPYAYKAFLELCEAENYHYTLKNKHLSLSFTNHEFSEWFIEINQTASGETNLRTGYYYK